ncbi:MAG: glycosyltransferase family 2 protein, partial [Janibacter sp.]
MTVPEEQPVSGSVTVVVPTRNNIRTIEACLRSVTEQSHPHIELVVVDNHSSDGTPQVAERFADRVITAGPERSAQRNTGIEVATSEWVLWLDSDMILPPRAVALAVETAVATGAT